MGNRGRLHDVNKRIVRKWTTKSWLICALTFGGRKRQIMGPTTYTELFFLDEPTALAAGHRPCAECRRSDYRAYKQAFVDGQGIADTSVVTAADMDRRLHADRTGERHLCAAAALPDGAMVALDGAVWLKTDERLLRWTPSGYSESRKTPIDAVEVLTPAATVAALIEGYRPTFHPSAEVQW